MREMDAKPVNVGLAHRQWLLSELTCVLPDIHCKQRNGSLLCEWVVGANALCNFKAGRSVNEPSPSRAESGESCELESYAES